MMDTVAVSGTLIIPETHTALPPAEYWKVGFEKPVGRNLPYEETASDVMLSELSPEKSPFQSKVAFEKESKRFCIATNGYQER